MVSVTLAVSKCHPAVALPRASSSHASSSDLHEHKGPESPRRTSVPAHLPSSQLPSLTVDTSRTAFCHTSLLTDFPEDYDLGNDSILDEEAQAIITDLDNTFHIPPSPIFSSHLDDSSETVTFTCDALWFNHPQDLSGSREYHSESDISPTHNSSAPPFYTFSNDYILSSCRNSVSEPLRSRWSTATTIASFEKWEEIDLAEDNDWDPDTSIEAKIGEETDTSSDDETIRPSYYPSVYRSYSPLFFENSE